MAWSDRNAVIGTIDPERLGKAFEREPEGRGTVWTARVNHFQNGWFGTIARFSNLNRRQKAWYSIEGWYGAEDRADGCWQCGPFATSDEAMAFVDKWIAKRRDPDTWRDGCGMPIGSRYHIDPSEVEGYR